MTGPRGQAARLLTPAGNLLLALVLVLAFGLGGLAWRLAQSPLELPFLAATIEAQVNAVPGGPRLSIGRAAIAWEGFHGGTTAPLDIRFSDVRLSDASAGMEADLPAAAATLSFRALLRGELVPATITLRRPRVLATLSEEGAISLSLGSEPAAPDAPSPVFALLAALMHPASDHASTSALRRLVIDGGEVTLVDPPSGRRWSLLEPRIDLRREEGGGLAGEGSAVFRAGALAVPVRITGRASGTPMRITAGMTLPGLRPAQLAGLWPPLAPLALLDAPVAVTANAEFDAIGTPLRITARLEGEAGDLDLGDGRRLPVAGFSLAAELTGHALAVPEARLRLPGEGGRPGPALAAHGTVLHRDGAWEAAVSLRADPVEAASLPRLWPGTLAPVLRDQLLTALPAGRLRDLRAEARFRIPDSLASFTLDEARLGLGADALVLDLGPDRRIVTDTLDLALSGSAEALTLERLVLRLPAASLPGPTIRAEGGLARRDGMLRAWLAPSIDRVAFADLAGYWPAGLGGNERRWLTTNVTAGEARNGQWRAEVEAPEADVAALRLLGLTGSVEAADVAVHWLRPIPPATGISGTAEFGPKEITVRARGGRQAATDTGRPLLELREGTARFFNLDTRPGNADLAFQLGGPLPEVVALLKHPRLKLFERRPLRLEATAGQVEAQLSLGFPLWDNLPVEDLRLRSTARVTEARLPGALLDQDLERGTVDLIVTTENLRASGQAVLAGAPVRLGVEMDFRSGPGTQVTERATLAGRLEPPQLAALGLDTGRLLSGPVALEARAEKRRNGQGSVALRADLREARLTVEALSWAKPPGTPGLAEATLRLQGEALTGIESFRIEALELALRGRASFGRQARLDRVEIAESLFGGSRFTGEVRRPERDGAPWQVALRGPLLDLRPILGPPGHAEGGAARDPAPPPAAAPEESTGPPVQLDLRFERVTMGETRNILGLQARARTDARGILREARATGRTQPVPTTAAAPFEFTLTPRGDQRLLRLTAEDGGALLHALDLVNGIQGGRLSVNGTYAELRPGAPLIGTAELDQFLLREAPAAARLLQAMTIYGLMEAAQGGRGLVFSRLVAPFTLTPEALTLVDARAFSASLGITAKGRILRERSLAEIEGTIVPAYVFNTMLGNLPLVGRLFSPEAGGGLFAATFRVQGPLGDPSVAVNPLAALTPGFLRGIFDLLAQGAEPARDAQGRRIAPPADPEAGPWNGRGPPPR